MYIPHHPKLKTQFLCPGLIAPRAVAFFLGPRRSGNVDWKPNLAAAQKLHKSLYVKDLHQPDRAVGNDSNEEVRCESGRGDGRVYEEMSAVRTLVTPTCQPARSEKLVMVVSSSVTAVMGGPSVHTSSTTRRPRSGSVFPDRESGSDRHTRARLALLAARIALFYLPRAS